MSFVTCKIWAQMANQMFQISACAHVAWKHGVDFKIPRNGHSPELPIMPFPHLPAWEPSDGLGNPWVEQVDQFGYYQDIPFWPKMRLHGYFQSYKYLDPYRERIIELFKIPYERLNGMVSVHVRRGDYLNSPTKHPVVNHAYLSQAIKFFTDKGYENFWIFSDDIPWCQYYFSQYNLKIAYSEGRSALEDLSLMSCCEHQIIANSTFSYWGAWLNRNPNKIVVTPSEANWFGPGNSHLKVTELLPPEWIRITY